LARTTVNETKASDVGLEMVFMKSSPNSLPKEPFFFSELSAIEKSIHSIADVNQTIFQTESEIRPLNGRKLK
jgi:hypothetical protein